MKAEMQKVPMSSEDTKILNWFRCLTVEDEKYTTGSYKMTAGKNIFVCIPSALLSKVHGKPNNGVGEYILKKAESHGAHAEAGFLVGSLEDPHWSRALLKDCNLQEEPMSKQFLKNCSLLEGYTLEKVMKDCLLWLRSHSSRAGEEWEEEGAAETKPCELTPTTILCPPCYSRGGIRRVGGEVEPGKKEVVEVF
ncbi:hypothetical protein BTVI_82620 [Pitangus sulphuratus]|nr:hypothetical protein BTVI_82620 [Pitangus sulphuratus]